MKIKHFFIFLIVVWAASCVESEVCSTNTVASLSYELIDSSGKAVKDTNLYYFVTQGLNNDSAFNNYQYPKSGILYLSPFNDTITYMIYTGDLDIKKYTITVTLAGALESNFKIIDTVAFSPDTLVTVEQKDTIPYSYIDTLTMVYNQSNEYLNDACGFTFEFEITDLIYTRNYIDSIKINYKNVLLDADEKHLSFIMHTPSR